MSELPETMDSKTPDPPAGRAPENTAHTPASRLALWIYGFATFFAFRHELPIEGGIAGVHSIDLGLVLAWIVPAALVVGVAGLAPRRAARVAFVASLIAHTFFFYWFVVVTVEYGGMPLGLGVLAPIVPALYVSIFTALFAGLFARLDLRGGAGIVLGAALWVAVDWARGHFLGGFPWATLGYALHQDLPLLVATRWGGVYVLSFAAAAGGLAIAFHWLDRSASTRRALLAVTAVLIGAHAVGAVYGAQLDRARLSDENRTTVRVAAIQGNIDQGEKWEAERRARILATYLRLSREAAAGAEAADAGSAVDWIVWPETAVPGLVENDGGLRLQLSRLAQSTDSTLVVGGMGVEIDVEGRRFSAFFDSAFQIDPDGALRDRYDKTHLVPFGEFVPLRGLLGQFFQSLATGLSSNDVTAGAAPRNMALQLSDDSGARVPVGVPICYELLFPDLVRRFAGQDARALLAITNDAWYGRTGAPHQFLAMTAMRAAENGLPTVRAANTGISAIIDHRGRVLSRGPLFEEAIVVGEIGWPSGESRPTLYARVGDVFALGCALITLSILIRKLVTDRRVAQDG